MGLLHASANCLVTLTMIFHSLKVTPQGVKDIALIVKTLVFTNLLLDITGLGAVGI